MRAAGLSSLLLIAVCAAVLAVPATLVGAKTPRPVALRLDGMSYVLSRGGDVDLVIEAAHADVSPASGRVELSGVRARLGALAGGSHGLGGMELACERGSLDLDKREFIARGAVDGRLLDGRTLRTEQLRYEHARGFVSSDEPVALTDPSGAYRGGGFQYWVHQNRFRLIHGARIVQGGT